MQIVSTGDDFHEITKPVCCEKQINAVFWNFQQECWALTLLVISLEFIFLNFDLSCTVLCDLSHI